MKRASAILVVLAVVAIGGVAALNTSPTTGNPAQASTAEQTVTFAVENMYCALCPVTVKTAMSRVAGVKDVSVSYETQSATVVFDPTIATLEMIAAASTNIGYPAQPTKS